MASLEISDRERLRQGESVLFFPSFGHPVSGSPGVWRVIVHGVVLDRSRVSRNRSAILALIRRYLARDLSDEQRRTFDQRSLLFRVARIPGRVVPLEVGDTNIHFERTSRFGYFRGSVDTSGLPSEGGWVNFPCPDNHENAFARIQLLPENGLSVISDIDDTIKVTEVWSRRRMLENTFLRPLSAVPGMPELYQAWAQQGAAFHYVSASPWQLCEALTGFLASAGFPEGSMHLKLARPRGLPWWKFLARGNRGKWPAISQILESFPHRHFVLVGDTSAHDPQIYAQCLRQYPSQIRKVLLRNVPSGKLTKEFVERLFRPFPKEKWAIWAENDALTQFGVI